jgi:hypothetical protein
MQKYIAILNARTAVLLMFCFAITFACRTFNFSYNLNITLFSIAVVFPLVFTIREAFKRRDDALEFLSQFKSAVIAVHYAFEQTSKLSREQKDWVNKELGDLSEAFFNALTSDRSENAAAERRVNQLICFLRDHRDQLPKNAALKIIRFLQDVHESMESTLSLKLHGTPVSLRAYCLVFVFIFPIVFTPTIVHHLAGAPVWFVYALSLLHGFVLVSLYNVQADMENPFDQIGLDDVNLQEFAFSPVALEFDESNRPPARKCE